MAAAVPEGRAAVALLDLIQAQHFKVPRPMLNQVQINQNQVSNAGTPPLLDGPILASFDHFL